MSRATADLAERLDNLARRIARIEYVLHHPKPCHCSHPTIHHVDVGSVFFGEDERRACRSCNCIAYSPEVRP